MRPVFPPGRVAPAILIWQEKLGQQKTGRETPRFELQLPHITAALFGNQLWGTFDRPDGVIPTERENLTSGLQCFLRRSAKIERSAEPTLV